MAKRINNNRKIGKDRVRKKRYQKNKIIIAVEGNNKTEKIYFNNFDDGKKNYSISYAKGNSTDPYNLVKMLIEEINKIGLDLDDGDKAYCIFDTDIDINKNNIINKARELANKNHIKIISNSPSIELWFLLHFEYTTAYMNNKTLINKLKKYYPNYQKNINIYPDINSNIKLALERAKQLEKYQIDNGKNIGTVEANPCSEMYKIINELVIH